MTDAAPADRAEDLARQLRDTNFLLNQKIVQLETLYEAGLSLGASLQLEQIGGEFLFLAVAMVDARAGFLLLRDERRHLIVAQHTNLDPAQLELLQTTSFKDKLRRSARATGKNRADKLATQLAGNHMLVVPVGEEGLVGVLDRETHQGITTFGEEDHHLLKLCCQQAGTALANARLYRSMVEEKNLTQSIVSSIANGVISTDLQGYMVRVNPAVERIFSSEDKFVGKSCAHLFHRYGCQRIAAAVRATLRDGTERQVDAERMLRGDLDLEARISPLRDEKGQIQGLVIALEDLTEQTRVRTMFKQYASDQVVDQLLAVDTQPVLGGEEREVAILFIDLAASTETLNQVGAQEMVRLLNNCFTRLVDIIFDHQGFLDKYTGDGFMAVFGAPLSFGDDSRRAVESALAIGHAMQRFNSDNSLEWGIRIGISEGKAMAGNIGSLRRMEYSVIGSNVNLAARLCEQALSGQILVGTNTYENLKDSFAFASIGHQTFKNIRQPIEVFELLGPPDQQHQQPTAPEIKAEDEPTRIELEIPMLADMELMAMQTTESVGHLMGLQEEKVEEVKMALIEACINAIEHSQSKDKRLRITFTVAADALVVTISDRGHGFDAETMRQRLKARRDSGQRQRGWGLELMREFVDEVDVESGHDGTIITLVKYR